MATGHTSFQRRERFTMTMTLFSAGEDFYYITDLELEFESGSFQECFHVFIINDTIKEYDEFFSLQLSTRDPYVWIREKNATVTIKDDDCKL